MLTQTKGNLKHSAESHHTGAAKTAEDSLETNYFPLQTLLSSKQGKLHIYQSNFKLQFWNVLVVISVTHTKIQITALSHGCS